MEQPCVVLSRKPSPLSYPQLRTPVKKAKAYLVFFLKQNSPRGSKTKSQPRPAARRPFLIGKSGVVANNSELGRNDREGACPAPPTGSTCRDPRQRLFPTHLPREVPWTSVSPQSPAPPTPLPTPIHIRLFASGPSTSPLQLERLHWGSVVWQVSDRRDTAKRGRQSGGRVSEAFSWTSSYCGGGVRGSMEGGGTFLSGRLILKSLR